MEIQDVAYQVNFSEEPVDGKKLYQQLNNYIEISPGVPFMAKIPCKYYH